MIDRKQVMYDIEKCICNVPGSCMECSHYTGRVGFVCMESLLADVLALLKEQEPHVLSRDEMIEAGKKHDAVYVEEGVGRCFWGLAVEGIDPPEDKPYNYPGGVQFNVVDADDDMWDGDFYLMCDVYPEKRPHPMGWRAWSAKPTQEQMRTVKWE